MSAKKRRIDHRPTLVLKVSFGGDFDGDGEVYVAVKRVTVAEAMDHLSRFYADAVRMLNERRDTELVREEAV